MFAWAGCVLLASLALAVAARLAEQACRLRRLASRWCWLVAMALSVLLPFVLPLLPATAPAQLPALRLGLGFGLATLAPPAARAATQLPAWPWPALSLALLAGLAVASLRLRRRARHWQRTHVGGLEVYMAADAGPAVFGLWQPRIVLPEWLAREPTRRRSLALAHEQSHLQACDPRLLAVALLLLVAMPWNLPMWWQLRRLRCAIEVDCDRRVLRAGSDLVDYCETLIELSQHGGSHAGLMAAVSEPTTLLERRIHIMSAHPFRWSRLAAGACLGLAACALAVAAELAPAASATVPAPTSAHAKHALPVPPVPPVPPAPRTGMAPTAPLAPLAPGAPQAHARGPASADALSDDEVSPGIEAAESAKREAEEAQERADEARENAEEAEQSALEAKRDAEQQAEEAQQAKREAEQAAVEAAARKQDAEAAVRALRPAASAN